jgi:hypothetical protein
MVGAIGLEPIQQGAQDVDFARPASEGVLSNHPPVPGFFPGFFPGTRSYDWRKIKRPGAISAHRFRK